MGKRLLSTVMLMFDHKGQLSSESLLFVSCVLQGMILNPLERFYICYEEFPLQVTCPRYQQAYRVIIRLIKSLYVTYHTKWQSL